MHSRSPLTASTAPIPRNSARLAAGAALGLSAMLMLAGCSSASSEAPSSDSPVALTLQTSWIPLVQFGGSYVADSEGYYAKNGVDVDILPTLANTQGGMKRVPTDAFTLLRSYDSSVWSTLWRLQLPYTPPSLFASARIAAPTAVLAATLAEWLATGDGLGHEIVSSRAHSDYTGLWAAAAILTAVSLIFYSLVSAAERAVLSRYAPSQLG
jgi:hypothetical protein